MQAPIITGACIVQVPIYMPLLTITCLHISLTTNYECKATGGTSILMLIMQSTDFA